MAARWEDLPSQEGRYSSCFSIITVRINRLRLRERYGEKCRDILYLSVLYLSVCLSLSLSLFPSLVLSLSTVRIYVTGGIEKHEEAGRRTIASYTKRHMLLSHARTTAAARASSVACELSRGLTIFLHSSISSLLPRRRCIRESLASFALPLLEKRRNALEIDRRRFNPLNSDR